MGTVLVALVLALPATAPAATFSVTNTSATGAGSLQKAITDANTTSGADVIQFTIGTGAQTISPTVAQPLPAITEQVQLRGDLQPGFAGTPLITIDGTSAGLAINGLVVNGSGTIVRGLIVQKFNADGIVLGGAGGHQVFNSYVGTNAAGSATVANGAAGIRVTSPDNIVGPSTFAATYDDRDVISGNGSFGVLITGAAATGNQVQGNFIGTKPTDTTMALPNGGGGGGNSDGIKIFAAADNVVGGSVANAGNVVSGNVGNGVAVVGSTATGNAVSGNLIGLDLTGGAIVANGLTGVEVNAPSTTVGGSVATERNVISGNGLSGVLILGASASGNLVQGNRIGTDQPGNAAAPNTTDGVQILSAGGDNTIGGTLSGQGNLISGNGGDGVSLAGTSPVGNRVQGNFIGPRADGTSTLSGNVSNVGNGIRVDSDANTIGGTSVLARNVISGNNQDGVLVAGDANLIQGNFIGTKASGSSNLRNEDNGIDVLGAGNHIGAGTESAINIISGNTGGPGNGVAITGAGATGNFLEGNAIGVGSDGAALPNTAGVLISNAPGNTIGSTTRPTVFGSGNLISGNDTFGVGITGAGSTGNLVAGNQIGTDAEGSAPLGNGAAGVRFSQTTGINTVGSPTRLGGNVIAYNAGDGIEVVDGTGATFAANSIFANSGFGIDLAPDGVTNNDPFDVDGGANGRQNFPVIVPQFAATSGSQLTVVGALNTAASRTYDVRFFASSICNGFTENNGEGEVFLGLRSVTTNGAGDVAFDFTLPATVREGEAITATATDAANGTSEFSECTYAVSAGSVQFAASGFDATEGAGAATITVTRGEPATYDASVRFATSNGTATADSDFTATSGTVSFAAGETSKTFSVPIAADSAVEGRETVNLTLSDPVQAVPGSPATATLTIADPAAVPPGGPAARPRGPDSNIVGLRASARAARITGFRGTASDPDGDLAGVDISLMRLDGGARAARRLAKVCLLLQPTGRLRRARPVRGRCRTQRFLAARGAARWTFRLKRRLPRGSYVLFSRARDRGGRRETTFSARDRNRVAFRVR